MEDKEELRLQTSRLIKPKTSSKTIKIGNLIKEFNDE